MAPITLRPLDRQAFTELRRDPEAYAAAAGFTIGPHAERLRAVAGQSVALAERRPAREPWTGFLAIDGASHALIGTCGYVGPPDAKRTVEIAYYTFPPHEGQGYATAMATALRDIAAAHPDVDVVVAHTLAESNASSRILTKLGFRRIAELVDPEDGPIWRWQWVPATTPGDVAP